MKNKLKNHIQTILEQLNYPETDVNVQTPKQIEHGDLTTNIAMIIAKKINENPIIVAEKIISHLEKYTEYENINMAGPGFINIKINTNNLFQIFKKIRKENINYGKTDIGKNKKAIVEFVSANPTGPLTVAHGRGAIIGDVVSRILEWNGYSVDREYYFNNAGRQMRILGESVKARYLNNCGIKTKFPDEGYQGGYINDIAISFQQEFDNKYIHEETL